MDSWPVAERVRTTESVGNKKKQKYSVRSFPEVDVGAGGPNVVTLIERDGRFEWSSLLKSHNQVNRLRPSTSTTIFPATRPPPDVSAKLNILQKAERGANFLRTYLPDVDVPAELIREELFRDAQIKEDFDKFDPYTGNLLQSIVAHEQAFLAFPMGELNCELNISPFCGSGDEIIFKPSARPIRTFDTPIQQIATTVPGSAYLGVRTFGQTSFLEVDTTRSTPYLTEVATLFHQDTGGRAVVDVALPAASFSSLVVNDLGSVYRCSVSDGDKIIDLIHPAAADAEGQDNFFWRLARGTEETDYLLASERSLSQIDVRSDDFIKLFSPTGTDVVTSVEDQGADNIVKLCTTNELIWIDVRFARKPLLSYKHGRQYDRYLEARTGPLSASVTLVTSRSNSMVTLYDVSRSDGQPIYINAPSYYFFSNNDASASYTGSTLFRHPLHESTDTFSLIQLTERGSLHKVDLSVSEEEANTFGVSWNVDVEELETKPLGAFKPPYAEQAFVETDMSTAYDHIFCLHEQEREQREDENADAVYDLLEALPTFWQRLDAPIEHILTTYDAVLQAGDEPTQTSRADFLTEGVINSKRGYRALSQGRLSPNSLVKGSSWHENLTATLQRLDSTFPDDAQSGVEALKRYDLAENPNRSVYSYRYEKEAREQLTLDLALSADIFSSQPFSRTSNQGPALEDLTKTLSLSTEPPAVDFGYLRPNALSHYKRDETDESEALMGVRSLLKDWQIGTDPEKHVFVDHYDGNTSIFQTTQKTNLTQAVELPLQTQLHRPPKILAMSAVPPRPSELDRRTVGQSQPNLGRVASHAVVFGSQTNLSSQPQSQEYMMSTQVLPGVHGGRPTLQKKVMKKRVGGF